MFADVLTRWPKKHRIISAKPKSVASLYHGAVPVTTTTKKVSIEDLKREQVSYSETGTNLQCKNEIMYHNNKIYICKKCNGLYFMIIAEAHCGEKEHRAYAATLEIIADQYWQT